jgi:preprotein translocase subunit SecB
MKSFLKGKKDKSSGVEASTPAAATRSPQQTTQATAAQGPEFAIQRIYLKSLSFDAPHSPDIFKEEWKPAIDMQIQTNTTKLTEGLHEAVIKITVTGKSNDKSIFSVEVEQAGIFVINRFTTEQLGAVLGGTCPNILFPYAREAITELATRGTLPPIYLAPINFDLIYAQAIQRQQAEQGNK